VEPVEEFAAEARRWLDRHAAEAPPDYGAIVPPELVDDARRWQRALFDAGYAGIHWPVEHGGRGLTPEHTGAWIEASALAGVPPFLNMVGHVLAAGGLLAFGTDEQQAAHLRPTAAGELVWCQLFSEPGAGSDLASLATVAEPDDGTGGWRLTGQKVWCSNGRVADLGICLARTDPDAPRHAGISYFLVDMHALGVDVRPLRQMTGGSSFDEVFLDGAPVGPEGLLGPLHGGWQVAMATLTNERGHIGASAITLRKRLEQLLAEAAGLDPVHRDRVAALWCRGAALLALTRRQGAVASVSASLLKLGVTELLIDVAAVRTELAGAGALLADEPAVVELLASPAGAIAGGTTQVQRTIIGERILGLPRGI
jgi:alkylation response protein AidB-like acyl-CoA dehydrogenase